jgi:hypothetical protein
MSVHPSRFVCRSIPKPMPAVTAAMVLKNEHPLHQTFLAWLKGKEPSKRQSREFLATYPQLREGNKAA